MNKIAIAVSVLFFTSPAAQAWHYAAAPIVAPRSAPAIAHHAHHANHKFICIANPAGVLICTVVVMLVADEVKRSIDGPACATMKPRRSWFGMARDEPKLWRPLCAYKDPSHHKRANHKATKLWPMGK